MTTPNDTAKLDRDPRVDPRPGDVLKTARFVRMVQTTEIKQRDTNHGVLRVAQVPYHPMREWMGVSDWQRWAKKAEVIHHAG